MEVVERHQILDILHRRAGFALHENRSPDYAGGNMWEEFDVGSPERFLSLEKAIVKRKNSAEATGWNVLSN